MEKEIKHGKCKLNKTGFVRWCAGMRAVIADQRTLAFSGTARGLYIGRFTSLKTGKPTRTLIVLKDGTEKKKGIVLNMCPFCGGELAKDDPK